MGIENVDRRFNLFCNETKEGGFFGKSRDGEGNLTAVVEEKVARSEKKYLKYKVTGDDNFEIAAFENEKDNERQPDWKGYDKTKKLAVAVWNKTNRSGSKCYSTQFTYYKS